MQPVWLYYELSADGQVTSGHPGHAAIAIEDHLAEVPQGAFANDLLRQVVYHRTDAVGRLLPPTYAWRLATDAEVQALLKKRQALAEVAPSATVLTEGDGASTPADKSTAQTPAA